MIALSLCFAFFFGIYLQTAWELRQAVLRLGPPPSQKAALFRATCIVFWPVVSLVLWLQRQGGER